MRVGFVEMEPISVRKIDRLFGDCEHPKRLGVPSPENRDLRQLLWHRHRLVQMRTRIMNQLQALAMNEGRRRKTNARRLGEIIARVPDLTGTPVTTFLFQEDTDATAWRSRGVPVYGIYPFNGEHPERR
jgi:hypothetical protein